MTIEAEMANVAASLATAESEKVGRFKVGSLAGWFCGVPSSLAT